MTESAICPQCEQEIAVSNGTFYKHVHPGASLTCPMSGQLVDPNKPPEPNPVEEVPPSE